MHLCVLLWCSSMSWLGYPSSVIGIKWFAFIFCVIFVLCVCWLFRYYYVLSIEFFLILNDLPVWQSIRARTHSTSLKQDTPLFVFAGNDWLKTEVPVGLGSFLPAAPQLNRVWEEESTRSTASAPVNEWHGWRTKPVKHREIVLRCWGRSNRLSTSSWEFIKLKVGCSAA